MTTTTRTFARGELMGALNKEFSDVTPGFVESSESPVMWTPVIIPAVIIATQASCFCAAC
jgi:hypothetical protein